MHRSGDQGVSLIIMPKYEMDKRLKVMREKEAPSDKTHMPIGYDDDHLTGRKHYRSFFPDELEKNKEYFDKPSPFNHIDIKKTNF